MADERDGMFLAVFLGLSFCLSVSPAAGTLAGLYRRLEHAFDRAARHRRACIVLAGVVPILIRLALLPWFPPPLATVPDEFAHLLVGQTFAEGRVTNPTHVLWPHFESLFILQQPHYTGLYQAGYGATLALGYLVAGTPWAGIVLTQALALGCLCWLLFLWLPRRWALIGTTLAVCQAGIGGVWVNSYLGVPTTAIGGCLILGAIRLLRDRICARYVVLGSVGMALLIHTRPYDGLLLGVVFAGVLVRHWRRWPTIALAGGAVLVPALLLVLVYNWRVTGSPTKLPYVAGREEYGVPQSFFWQQPVRHSGFRHAELRQVYEAQLQMHENRLHPGDLFFHFVSRFVLIWKEYLNSSWLPLLVLLPMAFRLRRTRAAAVALAVMIAGQSLYFYFASHYMAPIYGALLLLFVQALRLLGQWRWGARPAGAALAFCTLVAIWAAAFMPLLGLPLYGAVPTRVKGWIPHVDQSSYHSPVRDAILTRLQAQRQPQLVIVRYSPGHQTLNEYVYNEPQIDRANIVWARDMGERRNAELLRYYADRQVWLLEPDTVPFRLTPYPTADRVASASVEPQPKIK